MAKKKKVVNRPIQTTSIPRVIPLPKAAVEAIEEVQEEQPVIPISPAVEVEPLTVQEVQIEQLLNQKEIKNYLFLKKKAMNFNKETLPKTTNLTLDGRQKIQDILASNPAILPDVDGNATKNVLCISILRLLDLGIPFEQIRAAVETTGSFEFDSLVHWLIFNFDLFNPRASGAAKAEITTEGSLEEWENVVPAGELEGLDVAEDNFEKIGSEESIAEIVESLDDLDLEQSEIDANQVEENNDDANAVNDSDNSSEFEMFFGEESLNQSAAATIKSIPTLNLEYKWTGSSPLMALKHENVTFRIKENNRYSYSAAAQFNGQEVTLDIAATTANSAREAIALKLLFNINKENQIYKRFSPPLQDLWKQWLKEEESSKDYDEFKKINEFIESVWKEDSQVEKGKVASSSKVEGKKVPLGSGQFYSLEQWRAKVGTSNYQSMLEKRQRLPAFQSKNELLDLIANNDVVIVSGSTGSGKSTQIPHILFEHSCLEEKQFNMIVTQPRRISAITLAARVAKEMCDPLGNLVGYAVKGDKKSSSKTVITYCTTGLFLKLLQEKDLNGLTHIVVDEVHERTLDSDFLLFLMKRLKSTGIKLILMSASVNASHFRDYFGTGVIFDISGTNFSVQEHYLEDVLELTGYTLDSESPYAKRSEIIDDFKVKVTGRGGQKHYINSSIDASEKHNQSTVEKVLALMDMKKINFDLIVKLLFYILEQKPAGEGSVLIFLPGYFEIQSLEELLREEFQVGTHKAPHKLWILPLHGSMPVQKQESVFEIPPAGVWKVVLSTNVAETGITIPDVVYVIDTMIAREVGFDQKRGISRLSDITISKANAKQRRGRAGRVKPVKECMINWYLYTNELDHRPAEAVRLPVEEICLKFRAIFPSPKETIERGLSEMIDPPPAKHIEKAVELLTKLDALDQKETLTDVGEFLANVPVDVRLGKMLIFGALFGCLDPILTICAIISSGKSVFASETMVNKQFIDPNSDLQTWVNAFNSWRKLHYEKRSLQEISAFCKSGFLSAVNLQLIHENRILMLQAMMQTKLITKKLKVEQTRYPVPIEVDGYVDRNSSSTTAISAALGGGLYPNVIYHPGRTVTKPGSLIIPTHPETKLLVHKSSVLTSNISKIVKPTFFAYHSIQMKTSFAGKHQAVVRDLSKVSPLIYILFASAKVKFKPTQNALILDENLVIGCAAYDGALLVSYRQSFDKSLGRLCRGESFQFEDIDLMLKLL